MFRLNAGLEMIGTRVYGSGLLDLPVRKSLAKKGSCIPGFPQIPSACLRVHGRWVHMERVGPDMENL